jgi:hypothetical protein
VSRPKFKPCAWRIQVQGVSIMTICCVQIIDVKGLWTLWHTNERK